MTVAGDLFAQDQTVVVAHDGEETPLVLRVRAELQALGYVVETVLVPADSEAHVGLEEVAREVGAAAAIRIVTTGGRVAVWLADIAAEKVTLREVDMGDQMDADDPSIALEAVEILRVGLMELGSQASSEPVEDTPPTPPVEPLELVTPEPPTRASIALELGPAVSAAGFESAPMVNIFVGFHVGLNKLVGLEMAGLIPLVSSKVEGEAGEAKVHFGLVGGGLRLSFGEPDGRWRPSVSAGFAALFLKIDGRADAGYSARDELVATAAPYLRPGVSLSLTSRVRVRLDVAVGWALKETEVRLGDEGVASFGQPFLSGILALEMILW